MNLVRMYIHICGIYILYYIVTINQLDMQLHPYTDTYRYMYMPLQKYGL